jgi:hypothetical protein
MRTISVGKFLDLPTTHQDPATTAPTHPQAGAGSTAEPHHPSQQESGYMDRGVSTYLSFTFSGMTNRRNGEVRAAAALSTSSRYPVTFSREDPLHPSAPPVLTADTPPHQNPTEQNEALDPVAMMFAELTEAPIHNPFTALGCTAITKEAYESVFQSKEQAIQILKKTGRPVVYQPEGTLQYEVLIAKAADGGSFAVSHSTYTQQADGKYSVTNYHDVAARDIQHLGGSPPPQTCGEPISNAGPETLQKHLANQGARFDMQSTWAQ